MKASHLKWLALYLVLLLAGVIVFITLDGWPRQYLMMILVGGALVETLHLITPPCLLKYVGTWPFGAPNWQSIERVPITLLAFLLVYGAGGDPFILWTGLLIGIVGIYMDRLDGKTVKSLLARLRILKEIQIIKPDGRRITASPEVAEPPLTKSGELWAWFEMEQKVKKVVRKTQVRVLVEDWLYYLKSPGTRLPMFQLDRSEDPRYPGLRLSLTGLGEVIDPLADKGCFIPAFIHLAQAGLVNPWVAALMILSDLISTVFRRPFDRLPVFRHLQRLVKNDQTSGYGKPKKEEKASAFGKTKVVWQFIVLLATLPASAGWLNPVEMYWSRSIASWTLGLGVLAGVFSTLSRLKIWQVILRRFGLRRWNQNFKEVFDHDVED